MSSNERIELFLKYQNQNMSFEDISEKMEIKPTTLRRTLNKFGYKSDKGKYVKVIDKKELEDQITFEDVNNKKTKKSTSSKNNNTTKKVTTIKNKAKTETEKDKEIIKKTKKVNPKKDRKINISQEDLDKLCEVYDWYIEVKDNKALKPKKTNKKDIYIEEDNIANVKSVNLRVDKDTWEDFERLCSNSSHNKKEIITQALKDFMKTYKNLL